MDLKKKQKGISAVNRKMDELRAKKSMGNGL